MKAHAAFGIGFFLAALLSVGGDELAGRLQHQETVSLLIDMCVGRGPSPKADVELTEHCARGALLSTTDLVERYTRPVIAEWARRAVKAESLR